MKTALLVTFMMFIGKTAFAGSLLNTCISGESGYSKNLNFKPFYLCQDDQVVSQGDGFQRREGFCISKDLVSDTFVVVSGSVYTNSAGDEFKPATTDTYFYSEDEDMYEITYNANQLKLKTKQGEAQSKYSVNRINNVGSMEVSLPLKKYSEFNCRLL